MNPGRILYRARQFWHALGQTPPTEELELVRDVLTPQQMQLFEQMSPEEQLHSIRVFKQLFARYFDDLLPEKKDLWVAALLHDAGKSRHRLSICDRVVIVLGNALFPARAKQWGSMEYDRDHSLQGWKKPFIVAQQHAEWGAQMAAEAGASPLTVALIRRHQNLRVVETVSLEDRLLRDLQWIDNNQ